MMEQLDLLSAYMIRRVFRLNIGYDFFDSFEIDRNYIDITTKLNRQIGPVCSRHEDDTLNNVDTYRKQFILICPIVPSLHIFFTLLGRSKERPKKCYCNNLPFKCYSISIEDFWSTENNFSISSMSLPKIPELKITTITLNKHVSGNGIYCEELKCSFDESFSNADQLINIFKSIFHNNSSTGHSLILLYKFNACPLPKNLILSLERWFPNQKATIFGCMVHNITICNHVEDSRVCQINADCITILISGMDMQSWTLKLNCFDNGLRLIQEFRNRINLKRRSLGIMITSECCLQICQKREKNNFIKCFPRIPLFNIYALETIEATRINGLLEQFHNKWDRIDNIVFMLITYN